MDDKRRDRDAAAAGGRTATTDGALPIGFVEEGPGGLGEDGGAGGKMGEAWAVWVVGEQVWRAKLEAVEAIRARIREGRKVTAADYEFLKAVEGEIELRAAAGWEEGSTPWPVVKGAVAGAMNAGAGDPDNWEGWRVRDVEDVVEEWVLRDGVVDGQRAAWSRVCELFEIRGDEAVKLLNRISRGLLKRYGFDEDKKGRPPSGPLNGRENQYLELVKSIEACRRMSGALEVMIMGLQTAVAGLDAEKRAAAVADIKALIDSQYKVSQQRDGLIKWAKMENRQDKRVQVSERGRGGGLTVVVQRGAV